MAQDYQPFIDKEAFDKCLKKREGVLRGYVYSERRYVFAFRRHDFDHVRQCDTKPTQDQEEEWLRQFQRIRSLKVVS